MPYRYDARPRDEYKGCNLDPSRQLLRSRFSGLLNTFTVTGTEVLRYRSNGNQTSVVALSGNEELPLELVDKREEASRKIKQIVGGLAAHESAVELSLMLDATPPYMEVEVYGGGSPARLARTIITADQREWLTEDAALRK